jgi:hypothetical protein
MKFENEIRKILQARKQNTDMLNVIEALGFGPEKYQQAFDIALEMDNRSLVKLLYSNFDQGKIVVEFTLYAKK